MATPTLTTDLVTICNGEATDAGTYTGGKSSSYVTDVYLHGSGSRAYTCNSATTYELLYTFSTAVDITGSYLRMWAMLSNFVQIATYANHGWQVIIGDGTNKGYWDYYGSDNYPGGWQQFVVDGNSTPTSNSGTNPDLTSVNVIGFRLTFVSLGKNVENFWWDVSRYGNKISAYGGTSSDTFGMTEIAAVDKTNAYGIVNKLYGVHLIRGEVALGDSAGTSDCYFDSSGEIIVAEDLDWVNSSTYKISSVGNTTGVTSIEFAGCFIRGLGQRIAFNFSDANIDSCSVVGTTLAYLGLVYFASGQSVTGSVFDDCLQIDPSSATFENNTVANSTVDALLHNDSWGVESCSFTGNAAAIEIDDGDPTTKDFTALIFSGNTYDVNNTSGVALVVNKLSGSNPSTYTGSAVTFSASYNHVIEGLPLNTEVTYVTAGTSTELFHVENASESDGNGLYKTTYTHGGGASVDILLMHVNYVPDISNVYGLTLPLTDATIKVQMFVDDNYLNP